MLALTSWLASRLPLSRVWRPRWRQTLLCSLLVVAACQGDNLQEHGPGDPTKLYWALVLNHHAVTLSLQPPYNTLALEAAPQTANGTPLPGWSAVQYVSRDPELVAVTSDGVLRAIAVTGAQTVTVLATLTADNLKHTDSVMVQVRADTDPGLLPVLDQFSITPAPPDSAKVGKGDVTLPPFETTTCFHLPTWTSTPLECNIVLPIRVLDASGLPIPGVPVSIRSADPDLVSVEPTTGRVEVKTTSNIHNVRTGTTLLRGSTTVFGIRKTDTLPFRVGVPVLYVVSDLPALLSGREIRIGMGGIVAWGADPTLFASPVDITFTDPSNVVGVDAAQPPTFLSSGFAGAFQACGFVIDCGNGSFVVDPQQVVAAIRRFPVPGVYQYRSNALGVTGQVVVIDER